MSAQVSVPVRDDIVRNRRSENTGCYGPALRKTTKKRVCGRRYLLSVSQSLAPVGARGIQRPVVPAGRRIFAPGGSERMLPANITICLIRYLWCRRCFPTIRGSARGRSPFFSFFPSSLLTTVSGHKTVAQVELELTLTLSLSPKCLKSSTRSPRT